MRKFIPWFVTVVVLIVAFGTLYAVVQQSQRSEANYPQIQQAQDTAARLDSGRDDPLSLVYGHVDMEKSLAPFTIIYEKKSGKVVLGSGYINGKVPKVDKGILTASHNKDYSAVTWTPKDGVRIAAVSVEAKRYYVLSGRSLKEVEKNETRTFLLTLVGFLVSLALVGLLFVFGATATRSEI